ncbi:MAG: immune inhibitor A, partial [candidate division Zixibacteria bacterium]|nr:immune inhibitor A [candidate division Zixibacteria bacterium]
MNLRRTIKGFLLASAVMALAGLAHAVAPSEEAIAKFKADGTWEKVMADLAAFKAAGGCQPSEENVLAGVKRLHGIAAGVQTVDTLYVPVILVDFPDYRYYDTSYAIPAGGTLKSRSVGTAAKFDSILFSRKGTPGGNPTGSMSDYYFENSYGKLLIIGHCYGWFTVSNNYSYYVGNNSGLGGGGTMLANDAVLAAINGG